MSLKVSIVHLLLCPEIRDEEVVLLDSTDGVRQEVGTEDT